LFEWRFWKWLWGLGCLIKRGFEEIKDSLSDVPIRGEFYGFTSKKTFFSYWGMLAFTIFVAFYFSFRASDDERVLAYKRLVEEFGRKNPTLANKYFGSWYERNIE
jgi:protein-S-isoprenylcysteine O-methyltransferase Ste14